VPTSTAPQTDLPPYATDGNYAAPGTAWDATARRVATGITGWAAAGATPEGPRLAQSENEWLARAQEWSQFTRDEQGTAIFGDGSDGDVTLGAGTTTLARDMYYDDLTVPNGSTLAAAGFRIFVAGLLTVAAGGESPTRTTRSETRLPRSRRRSVVRAALAEAQGSTLAGLGPLLPRRLPWVAFGTRARLWARLPMARSGVAVAVADRALAMSSPGRAVAVAVAVASCPSGRAGSPTSGRSEPTVATAATRHRPRLAARAVARAVVVARCS
jgi:hypothetical protein